MQEHTITEMAKARYQRTWSEFELIKRQGGRTTLCEYCKSFHVNYRGMTEWMSYKGLSVRGLKRRGMNTLLNLEGTSQEKSSSCFMQFMPASSPVALCPIRNVHINFPDGTRLTFQECSPEGIVTLIDTYARRMSAKEVVCSR